MGKGVRAITLVADDVGRRKIPSNAPAGNCRKHLIPKRFFMRRAIGTSARDVVRPARQFSWVSSIAAVAIALLLGGACAGPPGNERIPRAPSARSAGERAADILARAIRVVTVNPPGDEKPLAEYFVGLLREAGIEATSVETPPGDSALGRAAAWGRLRGAGRRSPIVLLSHLDVVPADAEAWATKPFAGNRADGYVMRTRRPAASGAPDIWCGSART
jgi:hypothetical protein